MTKSLLLLNQLKIIVCIVFFLGSSNAFAKVVLSNVHLLNYTDTYGNLYFPRFSDLQLPSPLDVHGVVTPIDLFSI